MSIFPKVIIAPTAYIGENVRIGKGTTIQHGAYIEKNCQIGINCRIGTYAVLREETKIGNGTTFGTLVASEGKNEIGNNVVIFTQAHITMYQKIEDWVWIGPSVICSNTKQIAHGRGQTVYEAPVMRYGCRIGGGSVILPRVTIGREALIGAGSLVTKDIPPYKMAYGVPAKVVGDVPDNERLKFDLFSS